MYRLREFEGYHENAFQIKAGFTKQDIGFRMEFRLSGPLETLLIPAKAEIPSFQDELWKHCCFEAFLQDAKSSAYWEFNFSPSRDWAIYRFEKYRERIPADTSPVELVIQQERYPGQLILKIDLRPKSFFAIGRVGLTTVLEHKDESLSYWALTHQGDKPDFHRAESFIINL